MTLSNKLKEDLMNVPKYATEEENRIGGSSNQFPDDSRFQDSRSHTRSSSSDVKSFQRNRNEGEDSSYFGLNSKLNERNPFMLHLNK